MKKTTLWIILTVAAFAAIFYGFSGNDLSDYPSGAPAGYTGSPGDGQNCTACHGGTPATVTGWITSDIPTSGYVAGSTYTITVTVTGTGHKGFEVSPQDPAGTLLGTLISGTGNTLTGNGKYVTHSSSPTTNPMIWTFQWVAPVTGTGTVTFYGAFTVSKPVTKLSTLVVNENIPIIADATATPSTICAGQTSQLDVTASGGNGTLTYSWTSNPSGFTSDIHNPVVQPTVNTQYIVTVSDGTQNVTSSTDVTVIQQPTAFPGNDTNYCYTITQFPVSGTATSYSSALWSTSGDGAFGNASLLSTDYFPGPGDIIAMAVDLTLTVNPVSPCAIPVSSVKHIVFDPCLGISGTQSEGFIVSVFPNPSTGLIHVSISGAPGNEARLTITDLTGITVASKVTGISGDAIVSFDLSSRPKGMYILRVQAGSGQAVRKIVIR